MNSIQCYPKNVQFVRVLFLSSLVCWIVGQDPNNELLLYNMINKLNFNYLSIKLNNSQLIFIIYITNASYSTDVGNTPPPSNLIPSSIFTGTPISKYIKYLLQRHILIKSLYKQ